MKDAHRFAALLVVGSLAAALPARATSHCWCKIIKSDCGDCNTSCEVVDYGAIAEFHTFQLGKDALCTAACNDKLAALTQTDTCGDLASNLHVPLPWKGEVHACWNVGTGSLTPANRTQVNCGATMPSNYPPPGAPYWRQTFFDDFKGKPAGASADVAACYDQPAQCSTFYISGPTPCAQSAQANLKNLNKCWWTVLDKTSWMSPDFNSFDPREVTIDPNLDNGVLILSADAVHPDGSYQSIGSTSVDEGMTVPAHQYLDRDDWEAGYDCAAATGSTQHDKCPVISGALVSMSYAPGGPAGFTQKYGRFEVRAKLPYGAGSFPAHWMLPQSGSWPGAGELDIMEVRPAADYVWQTLHAGVCAPGNQADLDPDACTNGGGSRYHQSKDGGKIYPTNGPNTSAFWSSYHVFAVEWDATTLRFSVDGVVNNVIQDLDFVRGEKMGVPHHWWNRRKWEAWLPVHVPDRPFHFILNQTVHDDSGKLPNPTNFVPQKHYIDYVKAWQRCMTQQDFCPTGGDLDVPSGSCAVTTNGMKGTPYPSPCSR